MQLITEWSRVYRPDEIVVHTKCKTRYGGGRECALRICLSRRPNCNNRNFIWAVKPSGPFLSALHQHIYIVAGETDGNGTTHVKKQRCCASKVEQSIRLPVHPYSRHISSDGAFDTSTKARAFGPPQDHRYTQSVLCKQKKTFQEGVTATSGTSPKFIIDHHPSTHIKLSMSHM